ncbi:MAG: hypothetical protein ABIJ58_01355 [Nanoarchaeota archaeon]
MVLRRALAKLSPEQIEFIQSGLWEKISEIYSFYSLKREGEEIPFSRIPPHIRNYNPEVYKNHLGDQTPLEINGIGKVLGDLEIRSFSYCTEDLRDPDSHARDYGCYGTFYEDSVFYREEEAFRLDHSCSCHHEGPSMELDPDLDYERITIFGEVPEAVRLIEQEYEKIERGKEIRRLERKTGKSAEEMRTLLGE